MAGLNDSLLQFDSLLLDVNENPSNTKNELSTDIDELHKIEPSQTEISSPCDVASNETLQFLTTVNNHIEMPEITNEMCNKTLDVASQNVNEADNQNSLTFNEILDPLPTRDGCPESYEVENANEPSQTRLDSLSRNTSGDNQNSLTFIEILDPLPARDGCPESYEVENANEPSQTRLDSLSRNTSGDHRNSDSGIHDSENNIVEELNTNFADLNLSDNCGVMIFDLKNEENDVQIKEEEFHDAVQFFKDPSSFTFLENAGSSNAPADSVITRSSLYVNFDPLHAKFFPQSVKSNELQGITEDDTDPEVVPDNIQSDSVPDIVNKHLANVSPRESLGNILISFDSPVTSKDVHPQSIENEECAKPQKLYTEEELQQALKIQELSVQETFLKNQHDLEISRSQKQQELEIKLQEQSRVSNALYCLLKEVMCVVTTLSDKEKVLCEKLESAEKEKDKLKEDFKTSVEDLQSVESTFSDFHKRYEQCKSMLKVYTQNESNLKQQLENMNVQLQEKDEMYKVLQSRTQEMLEKANMEVANVKKAGDAQIAVLKAQLKKAELKISSLESDVKHVKIENSKLSSICDDLMAKVSEA